MACKFCLQEKKCVEAHIIPGSFFRIIKQDKEPIYILSPKEFQSITHNGIYDKTIVCEDCEKLFSPWDDYAHSLLIANFPKDKSFMDGEKILAHIIERFDYHKLKLFFISVLWRASASNHKYFSHINTGPFEDKLKKMILHNDSGDKNTFSIIFTKFDNESLGTAMLNPQKEKLEEINYYAFYLGGFKVFVKVDNRDSSELMKNFILTHDGPLYVVIRDLRGSSEFKLMKKIARLNESRRKQSLRKVF